MNYSYIIFVLVIVLVAKAIVIETPNGRKLDVTRLPRIGAELVRTFEALSRRLFRLAKRFGVDTPPSINQWFEESDKKRETLNRERNSDGWSAVNVTDPTQVLACVEIWGPHPEGPRKLGDWRSALSCSVSEANQWRELSPDLDRLVEWKKEGLLPQDASGWLSNRSITPKEARIWRDEGFSSELATTWRSLGYSPNEARAQSYGASLSVPDARALDEQCKKFGVNPQTLNIRDWISNGFHGTQLVLVPAWISLGFDPVEATLWSLPPKTSAEWRDAGFSASESQQWLSEARTLTATSASEWKEAGFEPSEFREWCKSELNFALVWREVGVHSETEASVWIENGFSPDVAKDWMANDLRSAEISKTWHDEGFSALDAARWTRYGVTAERAKIWSSHGYEEPSQISHVNRMISNAESLYGLLQSRKTLDEIEAELDSSTGDIGFSNN